MSQIATGEQRTDVGTGPESAAGKPTAGRGCPAVVSRYPRVVMAHGAGGSLMRDLVEELFAPAFSMTGILSDGAVLNTGPTKGRLVFTTDSFVVRPLFFPGGDIGSLAVHGTVNDLAMMGARPLWLSAAFVLEEGLEMETLRKVVASMAAAAREAAVRVVTGDTKVVERGHGDGVFITTSGVGLAGEGPVPSASRIERGDVLLVNGPIGDHGTAILGARGNLGLSSSVRSDSAALTALVAAAVGACHDIHAMRDLTRGGLSAALNELARGARLGMVVEESRVPVRPEVAAACEVLGLDPMDVANEGKFVAAVPEAWADAVLEAMRRHPLGEAAAKIGTVVGEHPGTVVGKTAIGGERVIDVPAGELLPRIC